VPRRPSRSSAVGRAAALAVTVLLGGCAALAPRPLPLTPEARAAVALIEDYTRGFGDLRTQADIRIQRAQRRDRLTGVLLLRAPASLRFEALAPFGAPLLVVAASPDALTVWEVLDNRATVLTPTPEASARWLGLALGPDDAVAVLAGRAPLLREPRQVTLVPADAVGPALELVDGDTRQRVWFDPASGRPLQIEWTGGRYPARVVFDPADGDGTGPAGLTLATLDRALEVRLRYRNPQWNTGVAPEQVHVSVPDSVRIRDWR
jgi:outer membrane lipoprotein-sorting protein